MLKLRFFIISLLFPLFIFQCNSDYPVPDVYVNFKIELNNPYFIALQSVGNSVFIDNEGYRGIIVARTEMDKFSAYEATCTYDPDNSNAIVEIVDNVWGVCQSCESKYTLLLNGYPQEGPSGLPLKEYQVVFNQVENSLIIHN